LAKAALVGANTVKGPALLSVPTRSAATTAATKVLWSAEPMAISAMSFPWLNTLADSNKEKNRMDNFFIFLVFILIFIESEHSSFRNCLKNSKKQVCSE
jgi:hypothetical protein